MKKWIVSTVHNPVTGVEASPNVAAISADVHNVHCF